jgi:hypothetical protein
MDEDKDGKTDCADTGCQKEGIVVCTGAMAANPLPPQGMWSTLANAECSNGTDDDLMPNNFVDCADFGCSLNPDVTICPEANDVECSDSIDNNMNTFIDCEDNSCSRKASITVCEHELSFAECSDGLSNNGDPFVDCEDFSCSGSGACIK